jgi:RHH-type proline utilization regulon transcriptional repressor/proline dehydrogenase/delta 1-pyrroline-5-carboxylate dehydrogenase
VRRLLENGANSSFVNQIVDEAVTPEQVAADPLAGAPQPLRLPSGPDLFAPARRNSTGFDLSDRPTLARLDEGRAAYAGYLWRAGPLLAGQAGGGASSAVLDPATGAPVGHVTEASAGDIATAIAAARPWTATVAERAAILTRASDLYEQHAPEILALLAREAGKTLPDAVAELREAVDFLRYYAAEATDAPPRGIFACISPWNFPLAIFTGQIAAALAAGNATLATPAQQTPLIAARATELVLQAGVPVTALQLLPGGPATGAALTARPELNGVAFTGSTATAQTIRRAIAAHAAPGTPLIAETGGLNAMIVDSTALPEHAVRDIVNSAFRSAGQRCSALRCLYVQEDIAPKLLRLLQGAMDELALGNPWDLATDVGPVIDGAAAATIAAHIEQARAEGRVLYQLGTPEGGHFVAPAVIRIPGIAALDREIFGPVLHVATFRAAEIDQVIEAINATGYGLTFGLHTRIDDRVQRVIDRVRAGNIYVNRNQIGAVVGSQPFGGEGLSGTGPKAGGPAYLTRFRAPAPAPEGRLEALSAVAPAQTIDLPGPTGESNRLHHHPRGPILCTGPGPERAAAQARAVRMLGGIATIADSPAPATLTTLTPLAGVLWWGDAETARRYDAAIAARAGAILPLITTLPDAGHVLVERHVCIDTTAAGGNAALLAEVAAAPVQAA